MHIFLVNDDGIGSVGIMALMREALKRGHRVTMCAPRQQQSAASHRITMFDPIYVSDYSTGDKNARAYAIGGSPTDCVRVGLFSLVDSPVDMLISGINIGYNAGMAIHYSGTVGAATEGSLCGLHAMAVSIHHMATPRMYEHLAELAIGVAEKYVKLPTAPVSILNINAPPLEPDELKGVCCAPLSTAAFLDSYERRESPRAGIYYWLAEGARMDNPGEGTDLYMLGKGYVTLTLFGNPREYPDMCRELL